MDRKVSMLATNMIRRLHRQEKLSRLASEFYPNSCEENNSSVLQLLIVKGNPDEQELHVRSGIN